MQRPSTLVYIELATLLLVTVYDVHMISVYGSSWDNVAGYFNSLTMMGRSTYYEILREPLVQLLIIPIAVLARGFLPTVEVLTVLLSLLFFFAIRKLANALKVEGISAYMIALSGIVVGFMSILNATDILAAITVVMALAYYYEGKELRSSIFFGLSFLAKFTNLVFLLYMPLLFEGKHRYRSVAVALAVNLPWFMANYLLYGNPFYGYILANSVFASAHGFGAVQLVSAAYSFLLLIYQFIIIFLALFLFSKVEKIRNFFGRYARRMDKRDYYLVAIALVEYIYVGSAQSFVAWLGYPVYIAFLIMTLKGVGSLQNNEVAKRIVNATAAFLAVAVVLVSILYSAMPYGTFLNRPVWFSKNMAYNQSLNTAYALGCSAIYSNAWAYLMVYNSSVKSVYSQPRLPVGSCVVMFNTTNVGTDYTVPSYYTELYRSGNFSIFANR